jgi:hypothetical protein
VADRSGPRSTISVSFAGLAIAMIYAAVTLAWLLIALRLVNPTQLVSHIKEHPQAAV